MYHAIRRADRTLLWLNIFYFMFVSLLPFSTSVLNAFPEAFVAPLFFGANLAIIGWILFFQWSYANSQPDMNAVHDALGAAGVKYLDMDRSVEFFSKVLSFEKVSEIEIAGSEYERLQGVFGARLRVARMVGFPATFSPRKSTRRKRNPDF